jgi:hypothetical protein
MAQVNFSLRTATMASRARIIIAITLLLTLVSVASHAESGGRMLVHTFQQGETVVNVAISDLPSGFQGVVEWRTRSSKVRPFRVSQAEFDKMWSVLTSSAIASFGGPKSYPRALDAANNYVFLAAYMPSGSKKSYVIPKGKAPHAVVALASELRAYAK